MHTHQNHVRVSCLLRAELGRQRGLSLSKRPGRGQGGARGVAGRDVLCACLRAGRAAGRTPCPGTLGGEAGRLESVFRGLSGMHLLQKNSPIF